MEVREKLNIDPDDFFDTLVQSVLHDINNALVEQVSEEQIRPGFSYVKKMKNQLGQQGDVHVTILKFSRPDRYQAEFKSAQGINFISYEIEDLKDGTMEVFYQESFKSKNTSGSLNYRLLSGLYQRRAKKRMVNMLRSMEAYIQSKEKKETT